MNLGLQESWEVKRQNFWTLAPGLCIYLSHPRKLDTMNCELAAVKNQMATAEENLKIATEEIHKCK